MQPVPGSYLLGDLLVAGIDQQLQIRIQVRLVHLWQIRLSQPDPGDGDRITLVILTPPP